MPSVARIRKPSSWKRRAIGTTVWLVVIVHRDEDRPLERQGAVGADLRLGERHPEGVGDAHHLAGRAHLRARGAGRRPGNLLNGKTASLTAT